MQRTDLKPLGSKLFHHTHSKHLGNLVVDDEEVRAERRCGQLLKKMEKAKAPGDNQYKKVDRSKKATEAKTLKQLDITKDQSSKYQKLANVPEKEFEEAINLPGTVPSTTNVLNSQKPKPTQPEPEEKRIDPTAVWLLTVSLPWHLECALCRNRHYAQTNH